MERRDNKNACLWNEAGEKNWGLGRKCGVPEGPEHYALETLGSNKTKMWDTRGTDCTFKYVLRVNNRPHYFKFKNLLCFRGETWQGEQL